MEQVCCDENKQPGMAGHILIRRSYGVKLVAGGYQMS